MRKSIIVLITILAALCAIALLLAGCDKEQPLSFSAQRLAVTQHVFHSSAVTNTNGTAMDVSMFPKIGFQVEGIVNATVTFEATIDNDTWYAVEAVNRNNGTKITSTTADGIFSLSVAEFKMLRCPISSWVSGTITVKAIGLESGIADPADVQVSDITGTVDIGAVSGVVSVDATGQGDVPITLDGEAVVLTTTNDATYIGDIKFGESLPTGVNALGSVAVTSVTTGTVDIGQITVPLPAGSNAIGTVGVTSITTGTVDVAWLTNALPAGTNNIGDVDVASSVQLDAGKATPVVTNTTGSAAIAVSYAPGSAFWLESVTLHLSAAVTTTENITITLNVAEGAAYDTVLIKEDLNGAANLVYQPVGGALLLTAGDAIDVAWPNSLGRTYGLRIIVRLAQ